MNHPKVIEYISYLNHKTGERDKSFSDPMSGKFTLSTQTPKGTAFEFCEQEHIKTADPTLNLNDGSKIRVYMGGDPATYTAYASGAIEKHHSVYKDIPQKEECDPYDLPFPDWDWKTFSD